MVTWDCGMLGEIGGQLVSGHKGIKGILRINVRDLAKGSTLNFNDMQSTQIPLVKLATGIAAVGFPSVLRLCICWQVKLSRQYNTHNTILQETCLALNQIIQCELQ